MARSTARAARLLLATSLVASAVVAASRAQSTPQIFRAGTNLVYVDVYPRRDGRLVEGLTRDDFDVFEDGTRQAIQTFELVEFTARPADADRRDPTSVADS